MMIVWIAFTLMVVIAAVGLTIPLVRRYDARNRPAPETAALAGQIAEIEAQSPDGPGGETAEGMKAETIRRFLADTPAETPAARPIGGRALIALAFGLAAIVAIGGVLLYGKLGRPDLSVAGSTGTATATATTQDGAAGADAPPGHASGMIAQLEAKMRQAPDDPEGWRMLGWSYMQTGRFPDSAMAYGRAASLDPKNADYPSAQGEALVKAAEGRVTPEAEAAFQKAYQLDPTDPRARYFLAAYKDQSGDHAGAMADWIALLKSAPPGAPWAAEVRGFVIRIAASRGEDVTGKLPPLPVAAPADASTAPAAPAPTAAPPPLRGGGPEDAIRSMTPAEQQAMIHHMVDSMAAKLKANPHDATGWLALIRARMLLAQPQLAAQAYHDSLKAFAGDAATQAQFTAQAKQYKVPGA
jgi:cytochrome c-type biogenesis protein CcmH